MRANPTCAQAAPIPRWTRFVLVNNRVPNANAICVTCGTRIERGYVRQPETRRVYCDARCFAGNKN